MYPSPHGSGCLTVGIVSVTRNPIGNASGSACCDDGGGGRRMKRTGLAERFREAGRGRLEMRMGRSGLVSRGGNSGCWGGSRAVVAAGCSCLRIAGAEGRTEVGDGELGGEGVAAAVVATAGQESRRSVAAVVVEDGEVAALVWERDGRRCMVVERCRWRREAEEGSCCCLCSRIVRPWYVSQLFALAQAYASSMQ